MRFSSPLDRRQFLRTTGVALVTASLGWRFGRGLWPAVASANAGTSSRPNPVPLADPSPIRSLGGEAFSSPVFTGDEVYRPHDILWGGESYIRGKGGRPTTAEDCGTVIVGGGTAGLLAAYYLRDQNPVLLEQATQFGGNAKGESFNGTRYSIGAAYVTVPEEGSPEASLFRELGLEKSFRTEPAEEARVLFRDRQDLWAGETDPAVKAQATALEAELARIYEEEYPELPWEGALPPASLAALDSLTALDWLDRKFPELHPHLKEFLQLYSWSSFAGSLDELSAAQWLNFLAAETKGVRALPGGNAAIAQALFEKLGGVKNTNLRSFSIALEVKEVGDRVEVLYEDQAGELRLLRAKRVVMACPKYVARYLLRSSLPPERDRLWKNLPYRAYVVGNVLLKKTATVSAPAFDLFCLRGTYPEAPMPGHRTDRPVADIVMAAWAQPDAGRNVLTIYRPYAFEGGRPLLVHEGALPKLNEELGRDLPHWLAQLGLDADSVEAVRWTRWGHALPLARAGMVADGTLAAIGAPLGERIFFANQDDFMNPAFETCVAAARRAADAARE